LEFDHSEQRFVWSGSVESLDFSGRVKIDAPNCDIVLKYDVFVADFLVAAICLSMRLSGEALPVQTVSATTHAARTGFASYASNDRALVTHMVGAIERSAGISVFQDCLDLKASEAWKPRLSREIGSRDLFFLFWSHSAAESTWVEWEWKTALQEKGKAAMRIQPLEPDVKPPSALEDLNFADVHSIVASYFSRAAQTAEAKRT